MVLSRTTSWRRYSIALAPTKVFGAKMSTCSSLRAEEVDIYAARCAERSARLVEDPAEAARDGRTRPDDGRRWAHLDWFWYCVWRCRREPLRDDLSLQRLTGRGSGRGRRSRPRTRTPRWPRTCRTHNITLILFWPTVRPQQPPPTASTVSRRPSNAGASCKWPAARAGRRPAPRRSGSLRPRAVRSSKKEKDVSVFVTPKRPPWRPWIGTVPAPPRAARRKRDGTRCPCTKSNPAPS